MAAFKQKFADRNRGSCKTCGNPIPYYKPSGGVSRNMFFCKRSCRELSGNKNPGYKPRIYDTKNCAKCGGKIDMSGLTPKRAAKRVRCANCKHGRLPTKTYYKLQNGYIGMLHEGKTRGVHVVKAEVALGRRLKKGEVVHHIDGDPSNNDNSNLLICTIGYHRQLHARMGMRYAAEHFGKGNWNPSVEGLGC